MDSTMILNSTKKKDGIVKSPKLFGIPNQTETKSVRFLLDLESNQNISSNKEKTNQFPDNRNDNSHVPIDVTKYDQHSRLSVESVKNEKLKLFSQSSNWTLRQIENPNDDNTFISHHNKNISFQSHAFNPIGSIVKVNESRSLFFSKILTQYKFILNDSKNQIINDPVKDLEYDVKGQKAVNLKNLFKLFRLKDNEKLKNNLQYFLKIVKLDELKEDFKIQIKDQSLIKTILPYIFDNLKRRFKIKSIAFSLFKSSYLDKDAKQLLSEKLILIFLLEAVPDINTLVYLGPMLILNDYPVPFAYWTLNDKEKFQ